MKKLLCPICNTKTRLVQSGNTDMSEWRRQRRCQRVVRWAKETRPSAYTMVFSCPTHGPQARIIAASKAEAHREINRLVAKSQSGGDNSHGMAPTPPEEIDNDQNQTCSGR